MRISQLALAVGILFFVEKFLNSCISVAEAVPFPVEVPFMRLATGTITSTILEKLLGLGTENKAKCALSLTNNLMSYRLIDPFIFLEHGEHSIPVPVRIQTNSTVETLFQGASENTDSSGLLFYKVETTEHFLVIFWKVSGPKKLSTYVENRFYVDMIKAISFSDKQQSLQKLYEERKSYSEKLGSFMVKTISVPVVGVRVSDRPKITIRAQMTTEKDGKLTVALSDNLSPINQPQLYKREPVTTTLALGIASSVLNVVFKKVYDNYLVQYLTSDMFLEKGCFKQVIPNFLTNMSFIYCI